MPYDKNILRAILLEDECRTLDDVGKALPPSNQVYRRIANRMALCGSHIEPSHVYTIGGNIPLSRKFYVQML